MGDSFAMGGIDGSEINFLNLFMYVLQLNTLNNL